MCAYNAVNGVPACADAFHMQTIARERWGFEGFVVSDCGAVGGIMHEHNYTRTVEDTIAAAMRAGVDLNCQLTAPSVNVLRWVVHPLSLQPL
jgi:beta-glucosidase-like glycosyl hydrolase